MKPQNTAAQGSLSLSKQDIDDLLHLRELALQVRATDSQDELEFLVVNDSIKLYPYRQSVFWTEKTGVNRLSGLVQVDDNIPYVHWLNLLCEFLQQNVSEASEIQLQTLPDELAQQWSQWFPQHALWLPLNPSLSPVKGTKAASAGLLFVKDEPWNATQQQRLDEWARTWFYSWLMFYQAKMSSWSVWRHRFKQLWQTQNKPWYQKKTGYLILFLCVFAFIPVHLTVLAPAELIPLKPLLVRSPLDGVVDQILVQPNTAVQKGDDIILLERQVIDSQYQVARQVLSSLKTEYDQIAQFALVDAKYQTQIALSASKIEQQQYEVDYLLEQQNLSTIKAQQSGMIMLNNREQWLGKPVQTGETILRIVNPHQVEVEAWLPIGDAIPLDKGAEMLLFLTATPLDPVKAKVTRMAYQATLQSDGLYSYRLRASLVSPTTHRVGSKGTAKIKGKQVSLYYWLLRRPLAFLRQLIGV